MEENQIEKESYNENNDIKRPDTANQRKQSANTVKWGVVFGIFMSFIYFCMAYLTLCTDYFFWIQDWARYGLGTIFLVYGVWRGYRYMKEFKNIF